MVGPLESHGWTDTTTGLRQQSSREEATGCLLELNVFLLSYSWFVWFEIGGEDADVVSIDLRVHFIDTLFWSDLTTTMCVSTPGTQE